MIAGPRLLEHIVDTVLYFESYPASRYTLIRSVKNRFGASGEMGVFAMTGEGFKQVRNPSAIFLSRESVAEPGSVVSVAWEGSRPLLVEIQALVAATNMAILTEMVPRPRRPNPGVDPARGRIRQCCGWIAHRRNGRGPAGVAGYRVEFPRPGMYESHG